MIAKVTSVKKLKTGDHSFNAVLQAPTGETWFVVGFRTAKGHICAPAMRFGVKAYVQAIYLPTDAALALYEAANEVLPGVLLADSREAVAWLLPSEKSLTWYFPELKDALLAEPKV